MFIELESNVNRKLIKNATKCWRGIKTSTSATTDNYIAIKWLRKKTCSLFGSFCIWYCKMGSSVPGLICWHLWMLVPGWAYLWGQYFLLGLSIEFCSNWIKKGFVKFNTKLRLIEMFYSGKHRIKNEVDISLVKAKSSFQPTCIRKTCLDKLFKRLAIIISLNKADRIYYQWSR